MAKIGNKNIDNLKDWDMKELRKLKISANNRISSLQSNPKKELGSNNVLSGMEVGELNELLTQIKRAEKELTK